MNQTVCVENWQPVPLRPLKEVLQGIEDGAILYIGPFCWDGEDEVADHDFGWVRYDQCADGTFHDLECSTRPTTEEELDLDRTMARLLQPGEHLVITYEG